MKKIGVLLLVLLFTFMNFSSAMAAGGKGAVGRGGERGKDKMGGKDQSTNVGEEREDGQQGGHGNGGHGEAIPGEKEDGTGEDGDHEGEDGNEGENEGGQTDKKGGVGRSDHGRDSSRGGSGKGNSGRGGSGTDEHGVSITLTVLVKGLEVGKEVNVTLTKSEGSTVVRTVNQVATFKSEPNGDCILTGEAVPGYQIPESQVRLSIDETEVIEVLEYKRTTEPTVKLYKDTVYLVPETVLSMIAGEVLNITADYEPYDTVPVVTWTWTSDASCVKVSEGLIEAVDSGEATITATAYQGENEVLSFSTIRIKVSSVSSFTNPSVTIQAMKNENILLPETLQAVLDDDAGTIIRLPVAWYLGETLTTTYRVPEDAEIGVQYVFQGLVDGTELTAEYTIEVIDGLVVPVESLEITDKTFLTPVNGISLFIGDTDANPITNPDTYQLFASIKPDLANSKNVTWTSSNPEVAIVDETGLVSAVGIGNALITAETVGRNSDGNKLKDYCPVSVSTAVIVAAIFPEHLNILGTFEQNTEFDAMADVYINVENLIKNYRIGPRTKYYFKITEAGNVLLGEGEVWINEAGKTEQRFQPSDYCIIEDPSSYSNMCFVYMSQDPNYPLDDERTLRTNFKIGSATPDIPKDQVDNFIIVNTSVASGNLNPEGTIFLLSRVLDESVPAENVAWTDYLNPFLNTIPATYNIDTNSITIDTTLGVNPNDNGTGLDHGRLIKGNLGELIRKYPYIYFKSRLGNPSVYTDFLFDYNGVAIPVFVDEVKVFGIVDSTRRVRWIYPKETVKLGGYYLLSITPSGYTDNLNLVNFEGTDAAKLKEVTIKRNEIIVRNVTYYYLGQ